MPIPIFQYGLPIFLSRYLEPILLLDPQFTSKYDTMNKWTKSQFKKGTFIELKKKKKGWYDTRKKHQYRPADIYRSITMLCYRYPWSLNLSRIRSSKSTLPRQSATRKHTPLSLVMMSRVYQHAFTLASNVCIVFLVDWQKPRIVLLFSLN